MYKAPYGAEPENIGKVVKIQIIPRESEDSDELLTEEMVYLVGRLSSFGLNPNDGQFTFRLDGIVAVSDFYLSSYSIEIYDILGTNE